MERAMDLPAGDALRVSEASSLRARSVDDSKPAAQTDAETEKDGAAVDESEERAQPGAAAAPPPPPPPRPPFSNLRLVALVLTVAGAAFLNTLGVQAAVIILPTIGDELAIPSSRQQWVVSAYSLTFGCFLLLWGKLGDIYGKKATFLLGSAWLTVTTLVLPFVKNEIGFDVLRALQGLGAAANVPSAIGILGVTFPPGKHKNYAFSCYGAGAPLGSVFGNILGGLIGQYLNWKWVFWVMAILAGLVTMAGFLVIPPPPPAAAPPKSIKSAVDWVGAALITVGLMVLMFALTEGNVVGWSTPWVPVLIVVAVLLVALFAFWQHHLETRTTRRPLVKVSLFRNPRFSAAMLVMMLFFASFSNYLIFATYFFQDYQGLSVIETMLRFIPTGVVGICVAFTTAHMLSRVKGNLLIMFGTLCVSISCLLFAVPIRNGETYWAFGFPAMCLCVFGADTVYPSLTLFTAHSLPQEDQALGGAIVNAVGQVGRAIGLAIATAVETAVIADRKGLSIDAVGDMTFSTGDAALLKGLRAAEWLNFAFAICAACIAGFAMRGVGKLGKKH